MLGSTLDKSQPKYTKLLFSGQSNLKYKQWLNEMVSLASSPSVLSETNPGSNTSPVVQRVPGNLLVY